MDSYCCSGNPDLNRARTSHGEQQNLTIRVQNCRITRLLNITNQRFGFGLDERLIEIAPRVSGYG